MHNESRADYSAGPVIPVPAAIKTAELLHLGGAIQIAAGKLETICEENSFDGGIKNELKEIAQDLNSAAVSVFGF